MADNFNKFSIEWWSKNGWSGACGREDGYALAAWEECKRQVIEILKSNEFEVRTQRGGYNAIDTVAMKEVEKL